MSRTILHQVRFLGYGDFVGLRRIRDASTIAVWTYQQSTGEISRDGSAAGRGYSGFGAGKNNAALQYESNIGPVPRGKYKIGAPEDLEGGPHGPFVLPLTPDPANEMFGRSGFLIHSDSISHPGMASRGCIILAGAIREQIVASGDGDLEVV
jgi:hypothetical protein